MKNEIEMFWHCGQCLDEKPSHLSPHEYCSMEAGWTIKGFQVWCKKHDRNIVNFDLMGNKVAVIPEYNTNSEEGQ